MLFQISKGSYIVDKSYIDVRSKTLSSSEKMLLTLFLSNYNSMVLKGAIEIQDLCMFAHLTQKQNWIYFRTI